MGNRTMLMVGGGVLLLVGLLAVYILVRFLIANKARLESRVREERERALELNTMELGDVAATNTNPRGSRPVSTSSYRLGSGPNSNIRSLRMASTGSDSVFG